MTKSAVKQFFNACSTGKADVVAQFLDDGTDVDARDEYGLTGLTGLMWAGRKGRIEIAGILLDRGAKIDLTDNTGRTSLFHAVAYKRYEFVRAIAGLGADVNVVDMHGWTPLDFARTSRHLKMVDLLDELDAIAKYSVNWKR